MVIKLHQKFAHIVGHPARNGDSLLKVFHVEQEKLVLFVIMEMGRIDHLPEEPYGCTEE